MGGWKIGLSPVATPRVAKIFSIYIFTHHHNLLFTHHHIDHYDASHVHQGGPTTATTIQEPSPPGL
jgi:hypothetical protein